MVTEKEYKGGAETLYLNGALNNSATSFVSKATPTSGWPTGASLPFVVTLDANTTSEETVLVVARSGTGFSSVTRGYAGTTAVTHADNATIQHTVDAVALTDMMTAAAQTIGKATAAGQILVASASGAFTALDAKTSGRLLVGNGTGLASVAVSGDATLASSGALTLANNAVTTAKITDANVTQPKLATGALRDTIAFAKTGTLTTGAGVVRWRAPFAITLVHTRLAVNTAPTGAAILVDVNKNGTTVYTTQGNRPTIAISANAETSTTAPDVTALAAGDYLTVDIDQVGSTVAGSDLTIVVYFTV